MSKGRFTIRRGQDYACSQSAMAQAIRNRASSLNLSAHLIEGDSWLTVILTARSGHALTRRRRRAKS